MLCGGEDVLTEYMPYIWLAVAVLSVFVEGMTMGLVSIWFVPAGLAAMVLALCGVPLWIQTTVFFAGSICLIFLSRTLFRKYLKPKQVPTNADRIVGQEGIVTEAIDNIAAVGQVKVEGQIWTARSAEPEEKISEGSIVEIVRIEGVKLIVRR